MTYLLVELVEIVKIVNRFSLRFIDEFTGWFMGQLSLRSQLAVARGQGEVGGTPPHTSADPLRFLVALLLLSLSLCFSLFNNNFIEHLNYVIQSPVEYIHTHRFLFYSINESIINLQPSRYQIQDAGPSLEHHLTPSRCFVSPDEENQTSSSI